jgi:Holliday junction resolvase
MARESSLEASLVAHAYRLGIYTRKFSSPGNRSVPDRIFIKGGTTLFIEVKAAGEKPTDAQRDEIDQINRAGGLATWVSNLDDGKMLLSLMEYKDAAHLLKLHVDKWNCWVGTVDECCGARWNPLNSSCPRCGKPL